MDDIIKNFSSPVWWVSVVIVGIFVSVIGAFLKDYVEGWASSVSSKLQKGRKLKKEAFKQKIQGLAGSSAMREKARFEILKNLIVSLLFLTLSVITFLLGLSAGAIGLLRGLPLAMFFAPAVIAFVFAINRLITDDTYIALKEAEKIRENTSIENT